jgi:hypothetical protein
MIKHLSIGDRQFELSLPDSLSDGGQFDCIEQAVEHALRMQQEGADIFSGSIGIIAKGAETQRTLRCFGFV